MSSQNKENRLGKKAFHKSIDLAQKPTENTQIQNGAQVNANSNQYGKVLSQNYSCVSPNQIPQQKSLQPPQSTEESTEKTIKKPNMIRQNSYNSIDNNSRRYSLFSKTSFATQNSFLFGTRVFNRSQQNKPVPKVNIQNIFKNKANMYLDEDLAHNFDDLLDKGYDMVTKQKQEKDFLKQAELSMQEEQEQLQKDIAPIYQAIQKNQEQLTHTLQIKQSYEQQIRELQEEMAGLQVQIANRSDDIDKYYNQYTIQIKELENQNNDIRSQININKAEHRQKINEDEKAIKQLNLKHQSYVTSLIERKKIHEEHKLSQATRLRKMENKCKMYLGILKH